MSAKRKSAYIKLLIVTAIWGASLPIVKPALEVISAFQFLFLRFLIAAPLLLPLLLKPSIRKLLKKHVWLLLFFGIFNLVSLLPLYIGLDLTTSLEASFLNNLQPLFITMGGLLLLHEQQEKKEWVGLLLALIGTSIIALEPVLSGQSTLDSPNFLGNLLIIGFVVLDSAFFLLMKHFGKTLPKELATGFFTWFGASILFLALAMTNSLPTISQITHPATIFATLYMGTLGTVLAFTLIFQAYQAIEASEASLFTYLKPIVYIPLGVLWLNEPLTLMQVLSLLLAFIGVVVAERR